MLNAKLSTLLKPQIHPDLFNACSMMMIQLEPSSRAQKRFRNRII